MDTLNIQIDKYSFKHKYAALRWRIGWKLQMSKWPWGTVYRYFWRKRLIKRINEVGKIIAEKSHGQTYIPLPLYDLPPVAPLTGIGTYAGTPVINPAHMYAPIGVPMIDPKKAPIIFIPPGFVPENDTYENPGII